MKHVSFLFLFILSSFSYGQTEYILKRNLSYSKDLSCDRCVLDLYYPKDKSNYATVVWFHGGGIQSGEKEIPEVLKNQGFAVVAVNYRLHPEVLAPVYLEDAAQAVAWTMENINKYGGDSKKVVLSGHSAGGYLALMVVMDQNYLKIHNIEANDIAALVPFSGHTITHFTIRKENGIPGEQPIIDKYAPLYHVRKDTPPITLITGDRNLELLGRYEENAYFYRMLKVNGNEQVKLIELQGYDHGMTYPAFPLLIKIMNQL